MAKRNPVPAVDEWEGVVGCLQRLEDQELVAPGRPCPAFLNAEVLVSVCLSLAQIYAAS